MITGKFFASAARAAGWTFLVMMIVALVVGVSWPLGIHWVEVVTDFWSKMP